MDRSTTRRFDPMQVGRLHIGEVMPQMNSSRILGGLVAELIMKGSEAAAHAGIPGDETGLLYE